MSDPLPKSQDLNTDGDSGKTSWNSGNKETSSDSFWDSHDKSFEQKSPSTSKFGSSSDSGWGDNGKFNNI